MRLRALLTLGLTTAFLLGPTYAARALEYEDYPVVKLRTLDKITARTMTFEAKVGSTMKFGEIFIKVQTCRKPPPVQKSEAAAFLQIWETDSVKDQSSWIFSGWMFSSSPTLSAMNHPVYDVWVIDCIGKDPEELPPPEATAADEGVLPAGAQPAQPSTEALGANGQSAPEPTPATTEQVTPADASTSGTIDVPAADTAADTDVEETVPSSNMPADAVPQNDPVATPTETAPVTPEQVPQTTPVTPAPESGSSDNFQGIY